MTGAAGDGVGEGTGWARAARRAVLRGVALGPAAAGLVALLGRGGPVAAAAGAAWAELVVVVGLVEHRRRPPPDSPVFEVWLAAALAFPLAFVQGVYAVELLSTGRPELGFEAAAAGLGELGRLLVVAAFVAVPVAFASHVHHGDRRARRDAAVGLAILSFVGTCAAPVLWLACAAAVAVLAATYRAVDALERRAWPLASGAEVEALRRRLAAGDLAGERLLAAAWAGDAAARTVVGGRDEAAPDDLHACARGLDRWPGATLAAAEAVAALLVPGPAAAGPAVSGPAVSGPPDPGAAPAAPARRRLEALRAALEAARPAPSDPAAVERAQAARRALTLALAAADALDAGDASRAAAEAARAVLLAAAIVDPATVRAAAREGVTRWALG